MNNIIENVIAGLIVTAVAWGAARTYGRWRRKDAGVRHPLVADRPQAGPPRRCGGVPAVEQRGHRGGGSSLPNTRD
ncbi:hypothetical protein [Streptomyces murinus]|uniref:hypothetical protein n=1 Tax=Streptomyces murinus TaxID=33900 RepID=UPI003825C8E0